MSRGVGDEGEEVEVPPALFEIEVEIEISTADVEKDSGYGITKRRLVSRPPPKLPSNRMSAPFNTARGYGEWLFDVMDASSFLVVKFLFERYNLKLRLKKLKTLVAFAKCSFQSVHELYYLEGLFIIATSTKHQYYIEHVYRRKLQKYWKYGL